MWRHQGLCRQCGQATRWERDREKCVAAMAAHFQEAHQLTAAQEGQDYLMARERQCDRCLEPCVDQCTKCGEDFCALHTGDIDGLCGACI